MEESYSEPVARLIKLGEPKTPWPDYPSKYGLTKEYIPELIRMAVDESSWDEDSEQPDVYRNVHAYRALGQLGAVDAARPLVEIFRWVDKYNDDWTAEELPVAFGMLGPAAIPALDEYLLNESHGDWARITAITGLEEIAERHPEVNGDVAAIMVRTLENYEQNDDYLNASLIHLLSKLRQPETYPLVEEVFNADRVDLNLMGDWEDFQVDVGLLKARETPKRQFNLFDDDMPIVRETPAVKNTINKQEKKEKNKSKQAKQMRKKNKKKK